jgi:hypothetical protein
MNAAMIGVSLLLAMVALLELGRWAAGSPDSGPLR